MFGPPENNIIKQLCGENIEAAKNDYFTYYSKNHWKAELYPGIIDILKYLRNQNYPLGIFTGKGRQASLITLNKLGVDQYFDLIVTGDDVINHKPSPEGILKFVNKLKLNLREF